MYEPKLEKDLRCPLEYGLKIFGGKWKTRVVCLLSEAQTLRYSALRNKMVPITDAVLASTLKELIADQIVKRQSFDEDPAPRGVLPHGEGPLLHSPAPQYLPLGYRLSPGICFFAVPGVPLPASNQRGTAGSTVTPPSPPWGHGPGKKSAFQGFYFTDISC